MNTGRNLADIFNAEIAHYANAWEWMQDRIDMGCYAGLDDEDFLPMTLTTGEAHEMQIAGKNTYTRTTDQNLGNHIDFISRDCYSETVQWNTTDNNNGTAEQLYPYLASNVYKFLNDDLYNKLPEDVKKVIVEKRFILEQRYSASGMLKDSTGWDWASLGKLWLPSEYEVFDNDIWATKGWSTGQAVQYSIFANSYKNRIKNAGPKGTRCTCWLTSVEGNSSTSVCSVGGTGFAEHRRTSNIGYVPICFRIAQH